MFKSQRLVVMEDGGAEHLAEALLQLPLVDTCQAAKLVNAVDFAEIMANGVACKQRAFLIEGRERCGFLMHELIKE